MGTIVLYLENDYELSVHWYTREREETFELIFKMESIYSFHFCQRYFWFIVARFFANRFWECYISKILLFLKKIKNNYLISKKENSTRVRIVNDFVSIAICVASFRNESRLDLESIAFQQIKRKNLINIFQWNIRGVTFILYIDVNGISYSPIYWFPEVI